MWLATRKKDSLKLAIAEAIEVQRVAPIMAAIDEQKLAHKSLTWHRTLDKLWRAYERELAARLLLQASKIHESDVIRQWTQQIVEIEPDMAMRVLGRKFILEKLELPDEAIPKLGPRRGQRAVSKKKAAAPKKKRKR